jgi:leucyl-tRNA synthetase
LVAATLRPETMYGQTNFFVLPEGVYSAFRMQNNEVFVCSERSAWNLTLNAKKLDKVCDLKGVELIGVGVKAPLTKYEKIYGLPMLSILMTKGTGIVTSVPSDAPDDYATLRDLK